MAPSIAETEPELPLNVKNHMAPKNLFPDGIRTSGQHEPIWEQLKPYDAFPKEIRGPTLWKAEDYRSSPERWVHPFSEEEIEELGKASDDFLASGTPLTGITTSNFAVPKMAPFLQSIKQEILNGKGFILFKGFPVDQWGLEKSATAYMGLGTHLGYFLSQNGRGHVLGHVKDLGEDSTQIDKVRIYRTNARQFFHADDGDVVGLLCIAKALEGGESDICSTHHIWNVLQKEHPEAARTLTEPIWYFDRKGEVSKNGSEYTRQPIFYIEPKENGRVYSKWDPYYVRSLTRFSDKGIIPPLSDAQLHAMDVLEKECQKAALHMILDVGDIQFLANSHIFHARTEYKDHAPPEPRRHLMRLWLAVPPNEGGWTLPFNDCYEKKRGGIQVDETPPRCPTDAE